MGLNAVAI